MKAYITGEEQTDANSTINVCPQKDYMIGRDAQPIKGHIHDAFEGRSGCDAAKLHRSLKEQKPADTF